MIRYNVDIWETPNWTGKHQKFDARCRDTGHAITGARDPEHEMCRILREGSLSDGQMQTFRAGVPSMLFRSIFKSASCSIQFDDRSGETWRLRKYTTLPTKLREAAE
jgi:hypothetical protein